LEDEDKFSTLMGAYDILKPDKDIPDYLIDSRYLGTMGLRPYSITNVKELAADMYAVKYLGSISQKNALQDLFEGAEVGDGIQVDINKLLSNEPLG